jgi:hypothetical protein
LAVDCFLNLKSQTWNNNLPHTLYNTCPWVFLRNCRQVQGKGTVALVVVVRLLRPSSLSMPLCKRKLCFHKFLKTLGHVAQHIAKYDHLEGR